MNGLSCCLVAHMSSLMFGWSRYHFAGWPITREYRWLNTFHCFNSKHLGSEGSVIDKRLQNLVLVGGIAYG